MSLLLFMSQLFNLLDFCVLDVFLDTCVTITVYDRIHSHTSSVFIFDSNGERISEKFDIEQPIARGFLIPTS